MDFFDSLLQIYIMYLFLLFITVILLFFAIENRMTLATVANLCQQANRQSCYHHEDEAKEEPDIKPLPTGEIRH